MMGLFGGKVAVVTGAGSGIGRATALAFAREGAKVVITDVNAGQGEETVQFIRRAEGEAIFIRCDVTQSKEVERMVNNAVTAFGRIDCAFNNAGIQSVHQPVHEFPEDVWDQLLNVNLKGVFLCMKHEIPHMLRQGKGSIVNAASVGGLIGTAGLCAYTASKHGVIGLTKTAALEYAKQGIRVNAVCPGAINTPMVDKAEMIYPEVRELLTSMHPIGRLGEPDEVAAAVLWLCSDRASFVTGHSLVIDGALTAQ